MTKVALMAVLILGAVWLAGCVSCEPDQEVPVTWSTSGGLNPYDGAPHKMKVYFFYVSSSAQFMNLPVEQLTAPGYSSLAAMPAGSAIVAPGTSGVYPLGPRGQEAYKEVGVLALYYQNPQRKVTTIPDDCSLQIRFEDRAVGAFSSK